MKTFMVCVLLTIVLTSCSTMEALDRGVTSFEPLSSSEGYQYFLYKSLASPVYPLESSDAEAIRMRWLDAWLEDNGLAGHSFEILERKPVKRPGLVYDIYYKIKVKE